MADYFIKKNSVYYINQDIYDNNGVLLLRKGQRITDEIKISWRGSENMIRIR